MTSVKAVSQKLGLSWAAVFSFTLLLAFILYIASTGSLAKYKVFLFGSVASGSSSTASTGSTSSTASSGSATSSASTASNIQGGFDNVENIASAISSFS